MANINTMYKSNVLLPNVDVYSLCKSSISWMLEPGSHTIHVPKQFVDEQLWCSYVPFGKKCTITTTGFKWNLGRIDFFLMRNYVHFWYNQNCISFRGWLCRVWRFNKHFEYVCQRNIDNKNRWKLILVDGYQWKEGKWHLEKYLNFANRMYN